MIHQMNDATLDAIRDLESKEQADHAGECCPTCGIDFMDGCVHHSSCCGDPVIFGTDFCSACKEHTGVDNV